MLCLPNTNIKRYMKEYLPNNIFKALCFLSLFVWMIFSCTHDKSADPQPNPNPNGNDTTIVCDSIIVCDTIIIICDPLNNCVTDSINCKKINVCDTITACDSATVKYSVDIEPIISTNCAVPNCHVAGSATGGIIFDSYEKVKAKADEGRIKARAIDNIPSQMPPAPKSPLSASDKAKLQDWIDQGACP